MHESDLTGFIKIKHDFHIDFQVILTDIKQQEWIIITIKKIILFN